MIPLFMLGMGDSSCMLCIGAFCAFCTMYGCHKCSKCHIRDCRLIKRLLRCCCCDPYPDMDLFVVIHELMYTAHSKFSTCVRVTACRSVVSTDLDDRGVFHQPISLFVEQGTESIVFEMLDQRGTILATLTFDLDKEIMKGGEIRNKTFSMKQKEKAAVNPRITLTIREDDGGSAARSSIVSTLAEKGASAETALILQDHIRQLKADIEEGEAAPSELDVLASSCTGALEEVGSWGTREEVYVSVRCPPAVKKHAIVIWKNKGACDSGSKPKEEIDLLKVLSVQQDAGQSGVFHLNYYNADKVKSRHTFSRVDRPLETWTECLGLLIEKCRELKEASKEEKEEKKDKKDKKDKKEKKKGK